MSNHREKKQATLVDGNMTYVATFMYYPKETDPFRKYCPLTLTVNGEKKSVSDANVINMIIDAVDTRWNTL